MKHRSGKALALAEADQEEFGLNRCDCGEAIGWQDDYCASCAEVSAPAKIIDIASPADAEAELTRVREQKVGQALIAFARNRRLCLELADPKYGGWYVIDHSTYDGDAISLSETPVEALLDWYESEAAA